MQATSRNRKIGNTGLEVATLGLGCASLGNLYRTITDTQARETVRHALDAGLRYLDTAPYYGFGLSERRVGDALRGERRDGFVLSTKVGRLLQPCGPVDENKARHGFCSPMPFEPVYDYSYDGIMRSYEHSLQRLGLNRIDILYIHDIGHVTHGSENTRLFKIAMESGYKALDELRSAGQISAFGLGVNEFEVCEQALEYGDFDCFLPAGRYTLLEQGALDTFLPRCEARNVSVIIGGVVGWVDMERPSALNELDALAEHPFFLGIRPMLQELPDPAWMLRPQLQPVYDKLTGLDLSFDALVRPEHLQHLYQLLDCFPDLAVVIDHGAKPDIANGVFQPWADDIETIATNTGACCKLSGLLTEAGDQPVYEAVYPYMRHLLDCFGAGRLLWGSDWPVLELAADYRAWNDLTERFLQDLSPADRQRILGANAQAFYGLS